MILRSLAFQVLASVQEAPPAGRSWWDTLVDLWGRELIRVEGEPITPRKIVVGLVLVVVGVMVSRLLSSGLMARLGRRFRLTEGAAAALQTVVFYLLVVIFTLSGLKVAGVPLTAFALVGGALAIGVGFGSQNVINNFISGLILLAERPIRVGDLVQLGDLYGTVERIGARSTRVRTGSSVEILVPNSNFLEDHVVNWTLSEDRVRVSVPVGVAYGSPTAEVARLMKQAAAEQSVVAPDPEPFVLFTDFGNDALGFEVHFWIRMKRLMDRLRVESDVRFAIDRLFREAGITIAFPQRDVHLDTLRPLDVRVVQDSRP